jgi:adenylate cyclase, class 2
MAIEYEATYLNINKDEYRIKLKNLGAELIRVEYKQKRYNFDLQSLGRNFWEWARVRDDGDKITMAYKCIPTDSSIEEQKEVEFDISDMDLGVEFLESLGARMTNYSETLRERWVLGWVEIDIDTWPYLEPYIEIEGENKEEVKKVSELLGFDFKDAKFCGAGEIYEMKYGLHPDKISKDKVIRLTFDDKNPFI